MKSLFSDRPHETPSLGFNVYATYLCELAQTPTNDDSGACTIGIFGAWGSGKTTLMKSVQQKFEELNGEKKYKTVWFNSWKYEGKEAIWNALIQSILIDMEEEERYELMNNPASGLSGKAKQEATELGKKFYVYSRALLRQLPSSLAKKYLEVEISEKSLEELNALYFIDKEHYKLVNRFEYDFKNVVDNYVGNGKLVVFIDDLDRCMPENALAVLEAIKLYLDYAKCVFFIGVDKRVIEQGVRERYPESLKITGKDYIEKMIQVDFYLPDKSTSDFKQLLIGSMDRAWDSEAKMWDMVTYATDCNIRKAKRFINSFNLAERIIGESDGEKPKSYLLKIARVLLVQMNFPEFFEELKKGYSTLSGEADIDLLKAFLDKALKDHSNNETMEHYNHVTSFIQNSSEHVKITKIDELNEIFCLLRQSGSRTS